VVCQLKLLVGLGNPGAAYERTRHNAGFWFLDAFAEQRSARFRIESRIGGETASCEGPAGIVLLLKPMGFMNRSGHAVSSLARYHKIRPDQILVAHDELDFEAGVARLKMGGGHGGHNGLRDILAQMGSGEFMRLRLGIGRSPDRAVTADYVLSRPSQEESRAIMDGVERALAVMPMLLSGDLPAAMNSLNTR
jgi:peptidyl-tRNA hydrolase, PTH1 family